MSTQPPLRNPWTYFPSYAAGLDLTDLAAPTNMPPDAVRQFELLKRNAEAHSIRIGNEERRRSIGLMPKLPHPLRSEPGRRKLSK